jgi:asparaginyl-tRNA synthetase
MSEPVRVSVDEVHAHAGEEVRLRGWLYNKRSSGKLHFLQLRDGTGVIQCVVFKGDVPEETFAQADHLPQESSLEVTGTVRADKRSPLGFELGVTSLAVVHEAQEYPIGPKEHGTGFLMDHRHLWLRSSRQHAILRIRARLIQAARAFFDARGFVLLDAPIFTPAACEGTTTLFETDYFGEKAYLSQSGQLYLEPAAAAFGRVYCFGPTFRAEKSKTRRHLTEFWMVEPEVAFLEFDGLCELAEDFIVHLVERALNRCAEELKRLERDVSRLEAVKKPFPRITYREGIARLRERGFSVEFGDDFGADEETALCQDLTRPLIVSRFPAAIKSFYMQPDPEDPEVVLGLDMLAPEGYGEIIGGSQRIHDLALLEARLEAHGLPRAAYEWYLDVRRYGTFPHSGFGMGLERLVTWICGIHHLREAIPYPRTLKRIYP